MSNPTDRTALREKLLRTATQLGLNADNGALSPTAQFYLNLVDMLREAADALAAPPESIDCPLCGQLVRQVSSATLSLALWQHFNWCHTPAAPPEGRETPTFTPPVYDKAAIELLNTIEDDGPPSSPPLPVEGTETRTEHLRELGWCPHGHDRCEVCAEAESLIRAYQAARDAVKRAKNHRALDVSGWRSELAEACVAKAESEDALDKWQR
jgi:hypothetical protein